MRLHTLGGELGADVVLLLHGFGADRFSWIGTAPALIERARVLAVDLPSHGEAGAQGVDGFDDLLDQVSSGLGAQPEWQMATRRHLIGHSLGGALAIAIAARSTVPIHTLSAIAPIGLEAPSGASIDASIDMAWLAGLVRLDDEVRATKHLQRLVENPRLITRQVPAMLVRHLAGNGVREALSSLVDDVPHIGTKIAADLASLELPRTLIWGEADRINRHDARVSARFGGDSLILSGCGHLPHIERRVAVNEALLSRLGTPPN